MVTFIEVWAEGGVGDEWVHFQSAAVASDSRGGTAAGTREFTLTAAPFM